ncbi:MAG: AtpZ/AtpI family protein [Flavobacteriaceae bacterium]
MSNKKPQNKPKPLNNYARLSGLAIQMFAIIGIGTFIGVKLDENFPNNHKLFSVCLSLTSVIVAIFIVIRRIIATSKENESES